ncbi:MAG: lipolytic enzyme, G-D-S-L [Clostridia bacterium]|nr:lipolytic enzyme, G-D-S-L [Clostridia bacterium]
MKKHIVCLGDSNTHGSCADPADSADGTRRYNEDERWPCLLQKSLGTDYLVLEEGLSGRTSVVEDPLTEGIPALPVIYPILMSHEPVDLLILMLGTNDTKDRFGLNPAEIAAGIARLIAKAKTVPCWGDKSPNILVVCPPHIGEKMAGHPICEIMGKTCAEKSRLLSEKLRPLAEEAGCAFLDAEGVAETNRVDYIHLSRKGHRQLAERLAELVPDQLNE